ncbi:MAG: phage virion morphogenesis protein [Stenotrophobium sp.]
MIEIILNDGKVTAVLARMAGRLEHPQPLFAQIGEALIDSTKRRCATSTAPDGSRWAPNAQSTYLRNLGRYSKTTGKDGRLNAKGIGLAITKKPLIGESGDLRRQFYSQVHADGVTIGSSPRYARTQQFGAAQGAFGHTKRGGPIPWGTIPPRPFLGVSAQDRVTIRDLVIQYLDPGA